MAGCMFCDYNPDSETCAECGNRSECADEAAYEAHIDEAIDLYNDYSRGE